VKETERKREFVCSHSGSNIKSTGCFNIGTKIFLSLTAGLTKLLADSQPEGQWFKPLASFDLFDSSNAVLGVAFTPPLVHT
jgi:hypothetical protein